MAGIFHPSRGGVRGGQDQFSWEDVKTDKDRENYLGHSLMVPVGKWQEGKDLMWYTRDKQKKAEFEEKRKKELSSIKEMENRAMAAALGNKSFSTGTTSLTAKELQDVLSRGQTKHSDGDVIKGMGYKKQLTDKQNKYGTEFVGGSETLDSKHQIEDKEFKEKSRGSKKKKKEKKKKKKKKVKKRKYDSQDDSSSEDNESSKPSSSRRGSQFSKYKKISKDTEIYTSKRRRSRDTDDSESSRGEEKTNYDKSYKHVEKYCEKKRRYSNSEEDSPARKKVSRVSSKSRKDNYSDNKRVKDYKYDSEEESGETSDQKIKKNSKTEHSSSKKSRSFSQPEDSGVKFVSRNKRRRHDSSSDSCNE